MKMSMLLSGLDCDLTLLNWCSRARVSLWSANRRSRTVRGGSVDMVAGWVFGAWGVSLAVFSRMDWKQECREMERVALWLRGMRALHFSCTASASYPLRRPSPHASSFHCRLIAFNLQFSSASNRFPEHLVEFVKEDENGHHH
jgi:hypothetical protein